jgi:hypothetical protein
MCRQDVVAVVEEERSVHSMYIEKEISIASQENTCAGRMSLP